MKFRTILADPPWPYQSPKAIVGNAGRGSQNGRAADIIQANVEQHYNTMSLDDIKKLDVEKLAADNSHLYLWTTNSFMVEAHEVARSWGFKPKTILTWVKVHKKDRSRASMKTGYWYRSATEHIVFAVRGKQRLLGDTKPTAYLLPRLPHSVKPDYFYDLIESESPTPYLELFARQKRLNWEVWGDEVNSTVEL
jgi:N6-adenosine-specific RNA methylase IME4